MNPRIEADTFPVCTTAFSNVRLMNDKRWPWFILLPNEPERLNTEDAASAELHDLPEKLRTGFMGDVTRVSELVKQHTQCKSVNIAMLGNVVPDLHCHVIAREEGDINWPSPVWGFEHAIAYSNDQPQALIDFIKAGLAS